MLGHVRGLSSKSGASSWPIWVLSVVSLMMSVYAAQPDKTAADYFVSELPGQPEGPLLRMHAGHIEITPEHNGNIFFWHYANRHIADRQRTVIWLNGGPGCSSEDGGLMEIGPYRVTKEGNLRYNDGSWDEFANLLFVDNPVGTGFSYIDGDSYLHELQEMADNFIVFLEKFFKIFPHYEQDDLYIAGESYAGQHIPYIARAVIERNKKTRQHKWNLNGLLIGNGWISAVEQYRSYSSYAYEAGLIQGGTPESDRVDHALSECFKELNKEGVPEKVNVAVCEEVLSVVLDVTRTGDQCVNMYDVRLKDSYPSCGMNWPPDLEYVTPWLRRNGVTQALHVNRDKREGWSECSGAVSANFRAVNSKSAITLLPGILEDGVPILLFSGDKDMICNHLGTEDLISNMKWNGGTGFGSGDTYAPKRDWDFEGEPAGIYQEARNLTYVKFYNSSHMVPFDYPRRSRDMLDRFMGVDIASIGGAPANSQIDGEAAHSETSVGGHPNSTAAVEHEKEKLHKAKLEAYYRSGEAVLVVVILIALLVGFLFWRQRRRANIGVGGDTSERGKYMSIGTSNGDGSGNGKGKQRGRDLEAADFDENELDDLRSKVAHHKHHRSLEEEPYDLASDTSIDDSDTETRAQRQTAKSTGTGKQSEKSGSSEDTAAAATAATTTTSEKTG